jgi:hypothetical protein
MAAMWAVRSHFPKSIQSDGSVSPSLVLFVILSPSFFVSIISFGKLMVSNHGWLDVCRNRPE